MEFVGGALGQLASLPLIDVREEIIHSPSSSDGTQVGVATFGPSKLQLPGESSAGAVRSPRDFWNVATGTLGLVSVNNFGYARRFNRTVANNFVRSNQLQFPLAYRPGSLGASPSALASFPGRRYVWEWVMWREALVAASVFGGGISSLPGAPQGIPSLASVTAMQFYFRSLSTENGGNWQVAYRPGFSGGALQLITSTFTPTVPRLFSMEFTENYDGLHPASLVMRIDGQVVATFNDAQLAPVITSTNTPFWGVSVGNEGAAAATFDWQCNARYRVFSLANDF